MKILLSVLILLFISGVYAECSNGQIDINSASQKDLEKLSGIGPVKAEAIIGERPFENIDELIEVYGIGEATLEKIKEQGFACVEDEEKEEEIEEIEEIVQEKEEKKELEVIKLSPKNIKTDNNISGLDTIKYGAIFSCILLIILFVLKIKFRKNGIE